MTWFSIWTAGVLVGGGLYLVARAIERVAHQLERANDLREFAEANGETAPQVSDR